MLGRTEYVFVKSCLSKIEGQIRGQDYVLISWFHNKLLQNCINFGPKMSYRLLKLKRPKKWGITNTYV